MIKPYILKSVLAHPIFHNTVAPIVRTPGVRVLMYHRISRSGDDFQGLDIEHFRSQVRWLASNCKLIRPEEIDDDRHQARSRQPAVLLTFDDGYTDFLLNAYPILNEYRAPALVFLPTEAIDDGDTIWPERVHCWLQRAREAGAYEALIEAYKASGQSCHIERPQSLKTLADTQRHDFLDNLRSTLSDFGVDTQIERQMMTWDQIKQTRPLIDYGAHTHTHPIAARMEPTAFEQDMATNTARLQQGLGEVPTTFAWPNGRPEDFSESALATVRSFGFKHVFTTIEGVNRSGFDRFAIRRLPATSTGAAGLNASMLRAA